MKSITSRIVISLCISSLSAFVSHTVMAAKPITGAFGQSLGAYFKPATATHIILGENSIAFGFQAPMTLPVLSNFRVLVSPLNYQIYSITATDELGDPTECRKWGTALLQQLIKKYVGEKYGGKAYEFGDARWKVKQDKTGRWISVECKNEGELIILYADNALFQEAQNEQREWNQLNSDIMSGQYRKALPRLRQLANAGNMQAQFLLGVMHRRGQGVGKNVELAENYYKRAAESGLPVAEFNLGTLYLTQKRYEEAKYWLKKSAEGGDSISQYNLGQLYQANSQFYSLAEAFRWFRQAAEGGHLLAQYNTCNMYSAGDGVQRNEVMAYKWCHIAALQGDRKSRENRDFIAKRMSKANIAQAREMAQRWLAQKNR